MEFKYNTKQRTKTIQGLRSFKDTLPKKIKKILGFETKFTITNAVMDLKKAFESQLLPDSFTNEKYFNIKRMNSVQLK